MAVPPPHSYSSFSVVRGLHRLGRSFFWWQNIAMVDAATSSDFKATDQLSNADHFCISSLVVVLVESEVAQPQVAAQRDHGHTLFVHLKC